MSLLLISTTSSWPLRSQMITRMKVLLQLEIGWFRAGWGWCCWWGAARSRPCSCLLLWGTGVVYSITPWFSREAGMGWEWIRGMMVMMVGMITTMIRSLSCSCCLTLSQSLWYYYWPIPLEPSPYDRPRHCYWDTESPNTSSPTPSTYRTP